MKPSRKKAVPFSQPLFDEMMEELMLGLPLQEICSGPTRPALRSFYRWLCKKPALRPQYRQARDLSADSLESQILSQTAFLPEKADTATVNLYKLRFDMLRWLISRRAPKRYGERQTIEHTGEEGGPIHTIQRIIIDPTTPDAPNTQPTHPTRHPKLKAGPSIPQGVVSASETTRRDERPDRKPNRSPHTRTQKTPTKNPVSQAEGRTCHPAGCREHQRDSPKG